MTRSIVLVGTILAAIWIAAASVLMSGDGPPPLVSAGTPAVKQAGQLHMATTELDPASVPVKAIALEQIARVTQLGVPPPRNVSPAGTTGWPTPGTDATRVSGALPAAPPPEPPEPDMFHRVVVENAGTLKSGTSRITLAHIETRSRNHKCHDSEGRKWPCGQAAVTELRMLIRGRSLACEGVKGPGSLPRKQPRTCHIGQTDIAEWLIAQGWVIPKPDAPERYREVHLAAQQDKRGIYGAAWGRGAPAATPPEPIDASVPEDASRSDT